MNVAVIGGGPLGLFFATHLVAAKANVTLVRRQRSRPGGADVERWIVESRLTRRRFIAAVPVAEHIPAATDVVVIAVRGEQLTDELVAGVLRVGAKAVVCLTPVLAGTAASRWQAHPEWVMAMPALAAEVCDGVLGYWVAPPTLVERRGPNPALHEFVSLLRKVRVPVEWTADAATRARANTVALFPLHVAVLLEPSLRRWVHAPQLRAELASAISASKSLARRVGHVDWALRALGWWLSDARRLGVAVQLLVGFAPRLTAFLEHHFGPKLAVQHAWLGRDIDALARELGLASPLPPRWTRALTQVTRDVG